MMKVCGRQSVGDKFPAQRLAEVRRPTEPNAGGTPIGNLLADPFNRQPTVPCRDHDMQASVRLFCTEFDFADEVFDRGAIIAQEAVAVREDDTEDSLAERIHEVEHRMYPKALQLLAEKKAHISGRKVRIG